MLVFGYALFFLPLFSFGLNGFVVGNYVTAASLTTESVICSESSACVDNGSIILEEFKRQYPVHLWKMYGLFTDEYLKRINTHWLKFPPPYPATHYSLAVLYAVIMLFGLTGNALVIFMFIRRKSLKTPANTLVVNLAVSDFLMMSEIPIFIFNSFNRGPALGDIVCRYYGFVGGLSGTVSICTLAAISLDRYYVVKFPLSFRFTSLRAKLCLSVCWIYGVVFSSIPLLDVGLGTYVPEGYLTSCSYDYLVDDSKAKAFILVFFVAAWVVPFVLITFCYTSIFQEVILHRHLKKTEVMNRDSSRHIKEDQKRRQEIRLAIVVFLVIGMWFAAWTPYAVVSLLGIADRADLLSPLSSMVPALFAKTASCIDPFVYAITHPRYRAEIRMLFCGRRTRSIRQVYSTSATSDLDTWKPPVDDDAEMVAVSSVVSNLNTQIPSRKNSRDRIRTSSVKVTMDGRQIKKKNSAYKVSWWFRPSFSNRSSSLKYFHGNLKREDEDQSVRESARF